MLEERERPQLLVDFRTIPRFVGILVTSNPVRDRGHRELRAYAHVQVICAPLCGPAEGCIKIGIKPRVTLGRVLSHFTQELL